MSLFDDDHGFSALEAGAAYALIRHGQDAQAEQIVRGLHGGPQEIDLDIDVHLTPEEERARDVEPLDFTTVDMPDSWDDYIGQEPMKQQLAVKIASAKARHAALDHILLASGYPGVGKTTMARLIARSLGDVAIYELVPPFNIQTLVETALKLNDRDILFIDEVHKLADNGKRGTEILLKILEEKTAYMPDGRVIELADITIIAATTDKGRLPDTVIDRFVASGGDPYFQPYSWPELSEIAVQFAHRYRALDIIDDRLAVDIAAASRSTPRIIGGMVLAARDMYLAFGRAPNTQELLAFLEVEPDGLTRTHIHYLTALRQYFAREAPRGEGVEYIVGEAAIQQILRETKPGIQRIEAFLVERGLIDRTPRGRRLTARGIARAEEFIRAGKGAADVA
jgi:Holliday junction DNA helicase RuvB